MKIVSWNVNGFRAILGKGFKESMLSVSPDVICLQEIKIQADQIPDSFKEDADFRPFQTYWHSAEKKGYSGVAIFSKVEPISVVYGLGASEYDSEGRVLTLEYEDFFLTTAYFPNSQSGLVRLPYKLAFNKAFLQFSNRLREKKNVLFCGDLNVAHNEIDLANPKANVGEPGFCPEEREAFSEMLQEGYVDIFRRHNPDKALYTWWSYRTAARKRNVGWRIDYFIANEAFLPQLSDQTIHGEIEGSDHCPIAISVI